MRVRIPALILAGMSLFCIQANASAPTNMIVNGDFETNSATGNVYNPSNADFNSLMSGATAYGVKQGIDIITVGSPYGAAPESGLWKVTPSSNDGGNAEQFSMILSNPLMTGSKYKLRFYLERLHDGPNDGVRAEIGVSNSATSFGTLVYQSPFSTDGWSLVGTQFTAPISAHYLTVRPDTTNYRWIGLDNFSLLQIPEPSPLLLLAVASLSAVPRWRSPHRRNSLR